ncbi:DUF6231 family protein [Acinetobacter bohemicus]|uniref:DUF6231 family protein n=1 Tax=unclassified Acinetobacter TaxID=196816 RepID=UPI001172DB64|nr:MULTISPECIES: DUF6231 family protein [unclassified Acinetobacter]MCO8046002.1 DUF6231 family protein [Acinetobacter sp. S4397-1]TQR68812.1 hypothetical protein E2K52_04435 [Acinetobacter sp. RF14B]
MAEQNVIIAMLDDFAQEQPIHTAICIGQDLTRLQFQQSIQWHHFSVSEVLNLPFQQRYDLAVVMLAAPEIWVLLEQQKSQILVKMRDLFAKRLLVICHTQDQKLLRALGLTQLNYQRGEGGLELWQFNILTYKLVPDWLNSKFWANPENWDKYRW